MVRYYTVANEYSKKFKKIDSARKYGIKIVMKNPYYGKANVSAPINDDKNRHIGTIYVDKWGDTPHATWVTYYWRFNENTGRWVHLDKRRELNLNGTLRKK